MARRGMGIGSEGRDAMALARSLRRAELLLEAGDRGEAEALLDEATRRFPDEAEPWLRRGEVRVGRQAWDGAEADFRRAGELAPSVDAACGLATTLEVRWRHGEAIAILEVARAVWPREAELCFRLGSLHTDLGAHAAAAAAYRAAIDLDPEHLPAWFNLGGGALLEGAYADAAAAYERVLALAPDHADARYNLGFARQRQGFAAADPALLDEAHRCFEAVVKAAPRHVQGWTALGLSHKARGELAAATGCLQRVLALAPDDATARFVLASIDDGARPHRVPVEVVEELFDMNADDYDRVLVDTLGYRVPALVADALGEGPLGAVLDLGCGTGLCGEALRPRAAQLVGVELSSRMLRRAEARGIYDALHHREIGAWLAEDDNAYQVIVAGDVLGYLGDLASLMAAIAQRLAPGGRFVATTEHHDGDGYVLRSTGRFAHGGATVDAWAQAAGLRPQARRAVVLRRQHGVPVEGEVHVIRRT